jgi:hypothetical protein
MFVNLQAIALGRQNGDLGQVTATFSGGAEFSIAASLLLYYCFAASLLLRTANLLLLYCLFTVSLLYLFFTVPSLTSLCLSLSLLPYCAVRMKQLAASSTSSFTADTLPNLLLTLPNFYCSEHEATRCLLADLLLLYCCFPADYCCFTAALLLLYCCFANALLMLYCCFNALLLLSCCFTAQ